MSELKPKTEHRPYQPEAQTSRQNESPQQQEKRFEQGSDQTDAMNGVAASSADVASAPEVTQKLPDRLIDQETAAIESILAEGMETFFLNLGPQKQQEFKSSGENTAEKIIQALRNKATRIKDIVLLIVDWLKNLPGINRFFLEQEAKIKADKIIERYRS